MSKKSIHSFLKNKGKIFIPTILGISLLAGSIFVAQSDSNLLTNLTQQTPAQHTDYSKNSGNQPIVQRKVTEETKSAADLFNEGESFYYEYEHDIIAAFQQQYDVSPEVVKTMYFSTLMQASKQHIQLRMQDDVRVKEYEDKEYFDKVDKAIDYYSNNEEFMNSFFLNTVNEITMQQLRENDALYKEDTAVAGNEEAIVEECVISFFANTMLNNESYVDNNKNTPADNIENIAQQVTKVATALAGTGLLIVGGANALKDKKEREQEEENSDTGLLNNNENTPLNDKKVSKEFIFSDENITSQKTILLEKRLYDMLQTIEPSIDFGNKDSMAREMESDEMER